MSIEKDLELMDDYLANRLSDAERVSFEQKLNADPALQRELITQQSFIEGIKKARIAELKNIMNNTPIPPAAGTGSVLAVKVASWLVAVGIVGFGIYWFSTDEKESIPVETESIAPATQPESSAIDPEISEIEQPQQAEPEAVTPEVKTETSKIAKPNTNAKVKQPKLDVYDPTQEVNEPETVEEVAPMIPGERKKSSSLIVETDNTQKKYNFHYQFKEGKLVLMGSFDATLYEILEFIADDKRTIFLYYSGEYYLLDERKAKPTPLDPITDTALQNKLDKYRGN